ncbi:MAG: class I SAM-dependent methyltransferase [Acidimicrobiales bacterium]
MDPTPSFAAVLAAIEGIEGWLADDQALRLWTRARAVRAGGRIVEIGSFRGRSTVVLASAAATGVEVVAIDPHAGNDRGPREIDGFVVQAAQDNEAFNANLEAAGVREKVRHVRAFSSEAHAEVFGPIELLYVDGAHRYRPALADVQEWGARVAPGGTMLVHDAFSSVGVTAALIRSRFWSRRWRYVGRSRSLVEYRHEPVHPARNLGRQLTQLPWFARNLAIKALIVSRLGRLTPYLGHREASWPY